VKGQVKYRVQWKDFYGIATNGQVLDDLIGDIVACGGAVDQIIIQVVRWEPEGPVAN
jgi:hypothetical protein